jgi:hypothetical protein
MAASEQLQRDKLAAELRKQRLNEAIQSMQGLAAAETEAVAAEKDAIIAETEAEKAPQDDAKRADADAKKRAAETAKQAAQDACIKAELHVDDVLRIGATEKTGFWWRVGEGFTRLGTWVWLVLFIIVGYLVFSVSHNGGSFLTTLGKLESARALIMVLILGTTLLMAVMLCYQAYTPGTTNDQFRMAREIYTTLIGVVGTVVGFYFATGAQQVAIPLSAVTVSPRDNVLSVALIGGTAPFKWELRDQADSKTVLKSDGKDEDKSAFNIPLADQWKGRTMMLQVIDGSGIVKMSDKIQIPLLPSAQSGAQSLPQSSAVLSEVKITRTDDNSKLNVVITGGKTPFKWELFEFKEGKRMPLTTGTGGATLAIDLQEEVWRKSTLLLKVSDDNGASKEALSKP